MQAPRKLILPGPVKNVTSRISLTLPLPLGRISYTSQIGLSDLLHTLTQA